MGQTSTVLVVAVAALAGAAVVAVPIAVASGMDGMMDDGMMDGGMMGDMDVMHEECRQHMQGHNGTQNPGHEA